LLYASITGRIAFFLTVSNLFIRRGIPGLSTCLIRSSTKEISTARRFGFYHKRTMSTSSSASNAMRFMPRRAFAGACECGGIDENIWREAGSYPVNPVLVVCGFGVTIATFSPRMVFSNVDFRHSACRRVKHIRCEKFSSDYPSRATASLILPRAFSIFSIDVAYEILM